MRFNCRVFSKSVHNIPCSGIGIEGLNPHYSFVWHWDVIPTKDGVSFGSLYSISEYGTGTYLVQGAATLDEAVEKVKMILKAHPSIQDQINESDVINEPDQYFYN